MQFILQGFWEALRLLFGGDSSTYEIALRSLYVSAAALAVSLVIGVPLGTIIALTRFRGRRFVVAVINTGMGVPPVVVGLIVALFLWRTGPLGDLHLMYTVQAMIIAQVFIALPIVAGLSLAALQQLDPGYRLQIMALGAGRWRTFLLLVREIRVPLMAAVMAAFGGVISEVGAVLMVGGNIIGQTEVLTTGIVTDVSMGLFASAVALAVVLIILSFTTNYAMTIIQQAGGEVAGVSSAHTGGPVVLEARDLSVVRAGKTLVHVDRFALAAGEIHVLLGPNGAGKTTLMRALNGIERADGELIFDGAPVSSGADRLRLRRHTAAVFQQAFLLATTVRGNVETGLRIHGVRGDELRRRSDAALEMLGIEQLADRRRAGLSGGEAQRVSIARALAVDPAVVFLDEPMASLDPPTRRSLLADLEDIFRRLSTAVLWVTHDTEEALAVAHRVTFLAEGAVVQEGATTDVFNNPAQQVVADYLGLDVWLEGRVEADESSTRLVLGDGATLVCADGDPGPALACIHPDDVMLFLARPEELGTSLRNVLEVTVRELRPAGRSRLVSLDWGAHRIDALLTRAACEELDVAPGQRVFAAIKASAIQLLPRAGGGRPLDTGRPA